MVPNPYQVTLLRNWDCWSWKQLLHCHWARQERLSKEQTSRMEQGQVKLSRFTCLNSWLPSITSFSTFLRWEWLSISASPTMLTMEKCSWAVVSEVSWENTMNHKPPNHSDPFGPRCNKGDVMGCGVLFPRDFESRWVTLCPSLYNTFSYYPHHMLACCHLLWIKKETFT